MTNRDGGRGDKPSISIVIPALNEEAYLGPALESFNSAIADLQAQRAETAEVVVVDNDSTDRTADVAREFGARVVHEPERNISKARNRGAAATTGRLLMFSDADVTVPRNLLVRVAEAVSDPTCLGGAVDPDYRPARRLMRWYVNVRRFFARRMKMAQGVNQFCLRDAFEEIGGYDETLYVGEDVRFYRALRKLAWSRGQRLAYLTDIHVAVSTRRHDKWPVWRTLIYTSAVVSLVFGRRKKVWRGWYQDTPR